MSPFCSLSLPISRSNQTSDAVETFLCELMAYSSPPLDSCCTSTSDNHHASESKSCVCVWHIVLVNSNRSVCCCGAVTIPSFHALSSKIWDSMWKEANNKWNVQLKDWADFLCVCLLHWSRTYEKGKLLKWKKMYITNELKAWRVNTSAYRPVISVFIGSLSVIIIWQKWPISCRIFAVLLLRCWS